MFVKDLMGDLEKGDRVKEMLKVEGGVGVGPGLDFNPTSFAMALSLSARQQAVSDYLQIQQQQLYSRGLVRL